MNDVFRISMVCEQLLQPVPGGIGTYVRAMLGALPGAGVGVEPVVAWHRESELSQAGLPHAVRLAPGRRSLYRRWTRGRKPYVEGDLVHAPSLAFPPRNSAPLVVTVHDVLFLDHPGLYPERGLEFHTRALERIGEADCVIVPSKATADAVKALDNAPENVVTIPMGTDYSAPPGEEVDEILEKLEVERPYVLWMGTVEPRKNPDGVVHGFVSALESWTKKDHEMNLYLVGPAGWWPTELGEFVETRGMSDRVRRLGSQPKRYREALYAGAEAFLFPSLAEGFGLPVLEAMACGTPVVTSNRSSLPEVAGAAALLCDPDDEDSIGEALAKVLRDADVAADLRRLGLQRAAEFGWDRTARMTAAEYHKLC